MLICEQFFAEITADGIAAVAAIVSALVAIVSVYLFNNSLRLIAKQNAAVDISVFKERYDRMEAKMKSYSFDDLKKENEIQAMMYDVFIKLNVGREINNDLFQSQFEELFHGYNGLNYFHLYNRLFMAFNSNPHYIQLRKEGKFEDPDLMFPEHRLILLDIYFLSGLIHEIKGDVERFITDLAKSDISSLHKSNYFENVKGIILKDYFAIIRARTTKRNLPSTYLYDLYYYSQGKVTSLFETKKYAQLAEFVEEMESKHFSKNN